VTIPRRFLPGHCHAASRRCAERRFFLRPSLETMHLLLYALGRALQGKRLALLVFSVQATHYHVVIADLSKPGHPSDLPLFFQHFNSMAARGLNQHLGRSESVWTQGSYHSLELWGEYSLLEQLLYAWIQPVKDGQAKSPYHWPGLTFQDPKTKDVVQFLPEGLGTTLTVSRPDFANYGGRRSPHRPPTDPIALKRWIRIRKREEERVKARHRATLRARAQGKRNKRQRGRKVPTLTRARQTQLLKDYMKAWREENRPVYRPRPSRSTLPQEVEIPIAVPPGFEHMDLEAMRQHFRKRLDEKIRQSLGKRDEDDLPPFEGNKAQVEADVAKTDPFAAAGPCWPNPKNKRRLDTRGLPKEERKEIVDGWWWFRGLYKGALSMREDGNREVAFPLGTYDLLRNHQVRIAGAPP